jgi:alkylhydroperoxidase/carboxymuconolactone decarboxylase family protein YurZ
MSAVDLPSPDELRARIEELRKTRGFLLPHHGAMAAALPDLHEAYFTMYRALTLTRRHLSDHEKEFVWLCVLIATKEAIGTHHLDLFTRAGGTQRQAALALRLTGYAEAAGYFAFAIKHWKRFLPEIDPIRDYAVGIDALLAGSDIPCGLADLALMAAQAAVAREAGVAAHIRSAYEQKVPEEKIAEALSLIIWPAGVNRFLEACAVWHELMAHGDVAPSPRFKVWASTPGQGGFEDSL